MWISRKRWDLGKIVKYIIVEDDIFHWMGQLRMFSAPLTYISKFKRFNRLFDKNTLEKCHHIESLVSNGASANVVRYLHFKDHEFWNVNISKTVTAVAKCVIWLLHRLIFVIEIAPLWILYCVTLTFNFKDKHFPIKHFCIDWNKQEQLHDGCRSSLCNVLFRFSLKWRGFQYYCQQ